MHHPITGHHSQDTPAPAGPILALRDVTFHYGLSSRAGVAHGARPILSNVSLAIHRGRALGLIGESGSGKSTIAKLLLGLNRPSSGDVCFDGEALLPGRLRQFRRRVQPVFQNPLDALNPRMRIRDQIIEPLLVNANLKRQELDARMADALSSVGLSTEIAKKWPHQISGGQAQRVTIARALILEPELLICDEPVSALDMTVQGQILNLLADLQQQRQLGLLFISHDIRAVSYLCSDIVVLHEGRIVEQGPRETLLTRPAAQYTRSLLAAIPDGHTMTHNACAAGESNTDRCIRAGIGGAA